MTDLVTQTDRLYAASGFSKRRMTFLSWLIFTTSRIASFHTSWRSRDFNCRIGGRHRALFSLGAPFIPAP